MYSRTILSLLLLAAPVLLLSGQADERLVLIRGDRISEQKALRNEEIELHFRGDGWVIVSAPAYTMDILESTALEVEIIDDDPWSEPYFFIHGSERTRTADIPRPFRSLATVRGGWIVKGPDRALPLLIDLGFRGVRIHDSRLPWVDREVPRFGDLSTSPSGPAMSIVSQVSDSTITRYVQRLQDFRTRYSCTDSVEASGQWIYDEFLSLGYTDVSFDSFPIDTWVPCSIQRNVIAVKPGTANPEEVIVLGGHYDSFTRTIPGCSPDTLAPGADDDASGTAIVLEAARIFSGIDTEKTLIFVAFGAEEQWMWGSYHFAEEAYNQGMDIVLMLNMDMVANLNDDIWDIDLWGNTASMPFVELVAEMGNMYTDLIPIVREGIYPGDAMPFWEYGYNCVYAAESDDSPHYHLCSDTIENISIPYLTDVARMTVASILLVSDTPATPSGFEVVNIGDGTSIRLDWDPNPELDLAGYRIYWGVESGVYDSVRTVTTTADTITNLIEDNHYYVAVSAFDTDDNESMLTREVDILVTARPLTPTGLSSMAFDTSIVLTWDPNGSELDLAGYNVYRRTTDGGTDTTMIAYVPDPSTTYSDRSAAPGVLYAYHVTAIDTEIPPRESDPSGEVISRLASHDQGVLVVDQTIDGSGGPMMPTDEAVDDFYAAILMNYDAGTYWDAHDSAAAGRHIMDYDLGIYSVVLWYSDVRGSRVAETDTTAMRKYLIGGGNLWLSGWQVGVDSARTTSSGDQDFIGAEALMGGFQSLSVDSGKVAPIGALYNMEVMLPPFSGSNSIYGYISSEGPGSRYHGLPVGVVSNSSEYGLVLTDFPLYFMDAGESESLVDAVMNLFGEPVSVGEDAVAHLPRAYSLSQNYPNPFNPMTVIEFAVPETRDGGVDVTLLIYNIRGERIRTLIDEPKPAGIYMVSWDGRDDRGSRLASGIYLYSIVAGDFRSTRKMVLVK
jgi:hypothetical protein